MKLLLYTFLYAYICCNNVIHVDYALFVMMHIIHFSPCTCKLTSDQLIDQLTSLSSTVRGIGTLPVLFKVLTQLICVWARVGAPCQVARRVMERSPHSMLVGEGALQFAVEQGFAVESNEKMLSDRSASAYQVTHYTTNQE